jgi:hypothetical protein
LKQGPFESTKTKNLQSISHEGQTSSLQEFIGCELVQLAIEGQENPNCQPPRGAVTEEIVEITNGARHNFSVYKEILEGLALSIESSPN